MEERVCVCGSLRLEAVGRSESAGIGVNVYRCLHCEQFGCWLDPRPPTWVSAVARHVADLRAQVIATAYTPH